MAVPAPGHGKASALQLGNESTWNTGVAATGRYLCKSIDNKSAPMMETPGALQNTIVEPAPVLVGTVATFDSVIELCYSGHGGLLDSCMGTDTFGSQGAVRTGAGPYVFTYKQRPYINSRTAQLIMGNIPAGKCERITGAKVASWELSGGESQRLVMLSQSWVGGLHQVNQTPTSLTESYAGNVRWKDLTAFDDGSGDTDKGILKSFSLKVDNVLPRREAGTSYTAEPITNGYRTVTLDLVSEFSSHSLLSKYIAVTEATNMSLTFTRSALEVLVITMPYGHLEPWGRPIDGPGVVLQKFTWKAHEASTSTDSGLTLALTTQDSTLI